jgi:hypothetical protein
MENALGQKHGYTGKRNQLLTNQARAVTGVDRNLQNIVIDLIGKKGRQPNIPLLFSSLLPHKCSRIHSFPE